MHMTLATAAALAWPATARAHGLTEGLGAAPPALLAAAFLAVAWLAYRAGARRVAPTPARRRALDAAFALAAFALLGPLEAAGAAAHMVQHMVLMLLVAPLGVLARPWPQWRATTGRAARPIWRVLARASRNPLVAAALHGVAVWGWHAPRPYALALGDPWWHLAEHASFLMTGWLFWHSVLRSGQRQAGPALLALLATTMHTGLLGALLTFARAPIYADAASLADQQLAGLVMWVPGGAAYLAAAAWCGRRWFVRAQYRSAPGVSGTRDP